MKNERIDFTPALLRNYFKVTLRKIRRQKGYTIINVSGLAVGLACCAIMLLWVRNEKSFEGFHANRDSIYRLIKETRTNGKENLDARIPFPLAETILGKIPEVKNYTRYQGVDGWKISYGDKFFYNDFLSTADSSFFEIFTFPFVKGDPKTALTDRNSIVVTESMAEKRTREIGLRKIFGASVGGMVWLQSREFSKWILISGVIAGPLAYLAAGNWLSSFAYHFNPGIGILLVTVLVTLMIAIFTVSYQSLKAAMADPVDSLKHE